MRYFLAQIDNPADWQMDIVIPRLKTLYSMIHLSKGLSRSHSVDHICIHYCRYFFYLPVLNALLEEVNISHPVFNCLHGQDFLQGFERVTLMLKMWVNANERQQHPEAFQASRCIKNTAGMRKSDLCVDKPWSVCALYTAWHSNHFVSLPPVFWGFVFFFFPSMTLKSQK